LKKNKINNISTSWHGLNADKRFTETNEYNIALNKAIKMDQIDNDINNSSLYGLVLISNLSKSFLFFN